MRLPCLLPAFCTSPSTVETLCETSADYVGSGRHQLKIQLNRRTQREQREDDAGPAKLQAGGSDKTLGGHSFLPLLPSLPSVQLQFSLTTQKRG